MLRLKSIVSLFSLLFLLSIQGCTNAESEQEQTIFTQLPELKAIKPEKPVAIKLKRSTQGDYSWELKADSAEKVIQADRKLRESLN